MAAAAALTTALCVANVAPATESEPDRYYHLAISRMMVEHGGVLDVVPQVEDLGWGEAFPDKETLFHVVTAVAYRLGGEPWVTAVPVLLCFAVLLTVMVLGGRETDGLFAAAAAVCLIGLSPNLGFRLLLLRPHGLAVLVFLLLLGGLRWRRPLVTGVSAAAFALAYHTHYLPLGALVVHGVLEHLAGRSSRRVLGAGLAGLALGVLLNPAFPGSLVLAWQHVAIAVGATDVPAALFPSELHPLTTQGFVRRAGAHALILLVAAALIVMRRVAAHGSGAPTSTDIAREADDDALFPVVGIGLLGLSLWVPRALEYAMPVAALTACVAHRAVLSSLRASTLTAARAVSLALLALWGAHELRHIGELPDARAATADVLAAIRAAPRTPSTRKLVNLHWQDGAFVLYERPDLRFVDLLDPSLLGFHNPDLGPLRHALADRRVPDIAGVTASVLRAQLVLARDHELVAWLDRDPQLVRLYPPLDAHVNAALFALDLEARSRFVIDFEGAASTTSFTPSDAPRVRMFESLGGDEAHATPSVFLRLDGRVGAPAGAPRCALLAPTAAERARLAGATVLGLGGGPWIRAALNGQLLVDLADDDPHPAVLRHAQALPRPFLPDDDLELLVCAAPDQPSFGVALSLWRDDDLRRRCPATGAGALPVVIGGATTSPLCAMPRASAP